VKIGCVPSIGATRWSSNLSHHLTLFGAGRKYGAEIGPIART
jgi:hypothetical protein